jgi:hypothetical protein
MILDTFLEHLTMNTNIYEGDPIAFFYAGYGSRVIVPDGWAATDGKLETICPYDERTKDERGAEICGISDRELARFLQNLAAAKGDNIVRVIPLLFYYCTLLLRCCCSDCHLGLLLFRRYHT